MVSISVGALFTVALGAMRDHGISLGQGFTISAGVARLGALLIFTVRQRYGEAAPDQTPVGVFSLEPDS